jgi:hypothetical protein
MIAILVTPGGGAQATGGVWQKHLIDPDTNDVL